MYYESPEISELIPESERIMADVVGDSTEKDVTANISDLLADLFG